MSADEKARRPERISRSFKYVILILSVILTLKVVFDAYSYYVARRDIDSELRSKKISSIEHLNVLAARERALAIMTLEERCNERVQITLFRILDAKLHDEIQRAFYEFIILKNAMVKAVEDFGPGTIDVNKPTDHLKKFTKRINDFDFKLSELDEYLDVGDEIKKTDRYQQLRDEINKNTKQYIDVGVKYKSARDKSDDFLKQNKEEVSALKLRVNYIDELREKRKELTGKIGELDDVLARYTVWTDALSGGATASSMLDEVAYKIRELDDVTLGHRLIMAQPKVNGSQLKHGEEI